MIVEWLQRHGSSLGQLPATALLPAAEAAQLARRSARATTGIAPLERLIPTSGADLTDASMTRNHDLKAIDAWLALRDPGSNTWRAYRREAERFLLWSWLVADKPLRALDATDCAAYRAFLAAPDLGWVGRRNTPRWSPHWRPLEGPLCARSINTAVGILRGLCEWLRERGYLALNPWDGFAVARPLPSARRLAKHPISDRLWIEGWLDSLPPDRILLRLRVILGLVELGLTPAGVAAVTVASLRAPEADTATTWRLSPSGRMELVLPVALLEALRHSFAAHGLQPDLLRNPQQTPLVGSLAGDPEASAPVRALTAGRIYEVIVTAAIRCAAWVQHHDPVAAARIRHAPTLWLRSPPSCVGNLVATRPSGERAFA